MRRAAITAAVATSVAWAVLAPALAQAAEGDLDPGFGSGGKVTTPIGASTDEGNAVAIDSQGRIIVAGDSYNGSNFDFAVARYNANGSLDPSFGTAGKVTTDVLGANDFATSVTIDLQGRIVAGGYARVGGDDDFAAARYLPSGALDTTFNAAGTRPGVPGTATYDFTPGPGDTDQANAVAIDSQGRIVLAGSTSTGGTKDFALARLRSDGSLDTTFGGGGTGMVTTPIESGKSLAKGVVIDSQDRIVAAGYTSLGGAAGDDFALARYTAAGVLDTSFNGTGVVTTPFGTPIDDAHAVAIDSQGRIVVAGSAGSNSNYDFALARYNLDGSLDTTFNGTGKVTTTIGPEGDAANGVAIDSQNRIVAAGQTFDGSDAHFALARYTPDGSLDTSFNGTGKVTTPIGSGVSVANAANAVAIDPAGRIVAAGTASNGADLDFALARYIGDQTPPNVTIGSGPADGSDTNDPTPTFEFSSNEAGSTFACGFDGLSSSCASPFTPAAGLGDGSHTFSLTATDKAGNTSAATTRTFTVDTRAPAITIKGKRKIKTRKRRARDKLKIKTSEQATLTCQVDRRKAEPCDPTYKTPKLRRGKHRVKVTATDQAGNLATDVKKLKVVRKR